MYTLIQIAIYLQKLNCQQNVPDHDGAVYNFSDF